MKINRCILFLLILCAANFFTAAQKINQSIKRCRVKTINFEQGLLNNSTTNIITDVKGFTWVSTLAGIQRYNGYTLQQINPVIDNDTINIISPVYFFALKNGSIWISYKHGVLEYNPYNSSFKKILSLNSEKFYYSIVPLWESNEGIWCMKEKGGIVILNRQGAGVKVFSYFNSATIDTIIQSRSILAHVTVSANQKYIFIRGKNKILFINTVSDEFDELICNMGELYNLSCSNSNLYTVSNRGLVVINITSRKIIKTVLFKNILDEPVNSGSVFFAGDNQLLVSVNRHLYEFDTACNYQKEFTTLSRESIVGNGQIDQIYSDKLKRIWLLTNDDIKRIQNVEIPFNYFAYTREKNNFVRTLYYDEAKHILLAGCYNGGIQLYDTSGNQLWQKPIINREIKDIIGIEKITQDDFLVITFGKGWYILNLPSKKIISFSIAAKSAGLNPYLNSFANNLQRINDSTIFITNSVNIFSCVITGKKIISVKPLLPIENNSSKIIDCFTYTTDKTLWAGTYTGLLFKFNENRKLQTITIPGNYLVRCITEDVTHIIWAGTDKGLYGYDKKGNLIKQITRESGLLNDCIYALLPADNGGVFASSNLGLSYISPEGKIKNYPKELGLQENEFNTGSAIKTVSGKLYFGGVNGITAFYPSALSVINDSPVLNITRLVVNDSIYSFTSEKLNGNSILLNYNQNHLRIDIAALGLLNATEYMYKYRLRGFENVWQTTYQPTGINYILEPGTYTLEVLCSPILSSEKTFYKKIIIIIHPPWWQTWWFKILAFVFAVTVIAFIIQQYNHKKYQQKIQSLQMQQEIQHERERISRDLHDNLGAYASAIASDVDIMHNTSSQNQEVLENLKVNASEIMGNLRETIWALNKEKISITGISDRFKNYIQKISPSYSDKKIEVSEQIKNDVVLSPVQALNVFRILQEAFTNSLKHSFCKEIKVSITSADKIIISVADDGCGINAGDLNKGNGLSNMRNRAKESGFFLSVNKANNKGTEIILYS